MYTYAKFDSIRLIKYDHIRTGAAKQDTDKPPLRILKVRNPPRIDSLWNGEWCNQHEKWREVSDEILKYMNFPYNEEDLKQGYFFIAFEDFYEIFDSVDFVHVNLNAFFKSDHLICEDEFKWLYQEFNGQWIPGINSGGNTFFKPITFTIKF